MAYNRAELAYGIMDLIFHYQTENCPGDGACALNALDALGFAAGTIFALAPDPGLREFSREYFIAAINEGLGGQLDKAKMN